MLFSTSHVFHCTYHVLIHIRLSHKQILDYILLMKRLKSHLTFYHRKIIANVMNEEFNELLSSFDLSSFLLFCFFFHNQLFMIQMMISKWFIDNSYTATSCCTFLIFGYKSFGKWIIVSNGVLVSER